MEYLILQFAIPFLIASLVVIAITVIAERFGTRIGGILGTVPSTIVVAFIFISLNRGTSFASKAAVVVPAEMSINLIFLFLFSILSKRGPFKALFISLSIWTILSLVLFLFGMDRILISIIIYFTTVALLFIIMEKAVRMRSSGSVKVDYTPARIAFRGLFAGFVIGTSVLLSNIGEIISGIFSVFPAIFLSTMLITLKEHGSSFSGGIGKSMMLGSQTVVIYAVSVFLLYPEIGILMGTIAAYLISLLMVGLLLLIRDNIS